MFKNTRYLNDYFESFENAIEYYDGENNSNDFIEWFIDSYFDGSNIIYYSNAIKFLSENDASLNESLELANEYGFEPKNLNSEVLANLLLDSYARNELYELSTEIQAYFDNLDNEVQ